MKPTTILTGLIMVLLLCGNASAGINVSLHDSWPVPIYTNYTGIMQATYLVESDFPLNLSSVAFRGGINNTVTDDMHSFIKVPPNNIASDGIYRANFRNTTPALLWEDNTTLTGGNVWQWNGYDNNSASLTKTPINSTHTWVNATGYTSIAFPSMWYLDLVKMVTAPMTGVNINKHQGIIIKVWDLEHLRGRNDAYWTNMYFDTGLQTTPDRDIDLWYCNGSFDPTADDPTTCGFCERMDTWSSDRWTDHRDPPYHSNSSYANPLTAYAGQHPGTPPDVINYIYLTSETSISKSYVLNATNYDPGVCNLTYAQTETMWLRDEVAGTNAPHAYTPSFYMTFVRDFIEFQYSLHIANDAGEWASNHSVAPIGISNILPTHVKYNHFWWGNQMDTNMNGTYLEDFWVNLTYGYDPDNDAPLSHVMSLYSSRGTYISTINDSLSGNQSDEEIFFDVADYVGWHQFQIISTDNEGTSTTTWSPVFYLSHGTDEEIPLLLFIVLVLMMFGALFYTYHAATYVSKIVTALIASWMSFMLSGMIISGTVVLNYAELSSADSFIYGSRAIQVASLSSFFMFTGVVATLFMLVFAVKLVMDTYTDIQEKRKEDEEWDGVDES